MVETMGLAGQARRMQAALSPVLVIGPDFLAGRRDADDMAHIMVAAVQGYANDEKTRPQPDARTAEAPSSNSAARSAQELQAALIEIYTCGSGYLADRCDSDCVVRTMTQIMGKFGDLAL